VVEGTYVVQKGLVQPVLFPSHVSLTLALREYDQEGNDHFPLVPSNRTITEQTTLLQPYRTSDAFWIILDAVK
jgi:hypothetical protein